ncbi:uncharacterized protein L969DRAFT_45595 [Mixia osmundae IAM 14324]|uniref:PH domain-containing protein n=1 Tax=Mixia osmundae (strain CBS 9802 / IAM 14324 / JCM 22182 / KY 12970) TaxID=764103 RepID=G7DYE7_MIXOS|nr:uncharacterized protein L969DRAFT_45595 [Mixia osmundae IAM 14324]KEI41509.1 hypothetical protein L969DRAFT_45595 [Mixia osmundae IAM 14324]GAA95607.1 hypothetical protein E5Q_02263 [Mixia osmundae IAM 14324]
MTSQANTPMTAASPVAAPSRQEIHRRLSSSVNQQAASRAGTNQTPAAIQIASPSHQFTSLNTSPPGTQGFSSSISSTSSAGGQQQPSLQSGSLKSQLGRSPSYQTSQIASPPTTDAEDEPGSPARRERGLTAISETDGDDTEDDELARDPAANAGALSSSDGPPRDDVLSEADIKAGYLMKKGERRKAWKKRYFVLRNKKLCYYKNAKEYQLLRDVPVADISTCAEVQVKKHDFVFGIVTPARTYYVMAGSKSEMEDWLSCIALARQRLRQSIQPKLNTSTVHAASTARIAAPSSESSTPHASQQQTEASTSAVPSTTPHGSTRKAAVRLMEVTGSPQMRRQQSGGLGLTGSQGQQLEASFNDQLSLSSGNKKINTPLRQESASSGDESGYFGLLARPIRSDADGPISPGGALSSSDEDEEDAEDGEYTPNAMTSTPSQHTLHAGPHDAALSPPVPFNAASLLLSPSALDPNKEMLRGYLMKQGKRKTWRKRWFVLSPTQLMYSRSHMDKAFKRRIPLSRVLDAVEYDPPRRQHSGPGEMPLSPKLALGTDYLVAGEGGLSRKPIENCFKIITAKRVYLICAPTEEDEIKWISSIRVLIRRNNAVSPGPSQQHAPIAQQRDSSSTIVPS